jgi:hypothetical protein
MDPELRGEGRAGGTGREGLFVTHSKIPRVRGRKRVYRD